MIFLLIALLFFTVPIYSLNCTDCVGNGKLWCVETSQCDNGFTSCNTTISLPLNCPSSPKFPYDENFMRNKQMVLSTAAHSDIPQTCFDNQLPTMKLYQMRVVNCSQEYTDVTCVGYTAYDITQKVIVMAFKGAHGQNQLNTLQHGFENDGLHNYFTTESGRIFKVVYDSFMYLWNGGMSQDIRQLKYKYPDYELWLNGHSLGGILSYVASAHLSTIGLYKPEQMKIAVMGAGRLGDYNFAQWYTKTFPYSFHIVHRRDTNTRYPVLDPHTNTTVLFHPKTEVWYNNFMNPGDPYQICEQADGDYCSEAINLSNSPLDPSDHIHYFNINLSDWGRDGCPKNTSAYAQPLDA